jgi:hypothetical protein
MKPYRVKRGSRYIGSFLVVVDGQRVNLQTKDATEARRRAALAEKGQWPTAGNGAARAVKEAIEGAGEPAPVPPEAVSPPVLPPEVLSSELPSAGSGAAGTVSTEGAAAGSGPSAAAPVSPADAVNATAAAEMAIEGEAKAALAAAGVDLGELGPKLPEYVGKAMTVASGQLARVPVRFIAGVWVPRPELPEDARLLQPVMGKCALMKLGQWGLDLERLGPGAWFLITFGLCTLMQMGAALAALPAEAAKPDLKSVP